MKVLHISHTYPLNEDSGITPFIHHIARETSSQGYEVHVLVPEHDQLESFDSVHMHTFRYSDRQSIEYKSIATQKEDIAAREVAKFVFHCFDAARQLDSEHDFDIVHAHWTIPAGIPAFLLRLFRRKKLVVHTHGRDVYNIPEIGYDVPSDWKARFVLKNVLSRADHVVSNSENCFSYAQQVGAKEETGTVIPYGVDLNTFSPEQSSESLRDRFCNDDELLLLYVGDLIYRKGVQDLIRAVKQVDVPIRLVIIGDGDYRDTLEELAQDADNITFLGFKPHDELPPYMATADALVVPSLIEAFGIVNIEALASGTPVIGAETGGIQDIITDNVGRLFEPGNTEELQGKIQELSDDAVRERLSGNARNRAETQYNWEVFGEKLDDVYQSL